MENLYFTKVIKVGTSLGIIIPKNILTGIEWKRGDMIIFASYKTGQLLARSLSDSEIQEIKNKTIQY